MPPHAGEARGAQVSAVGSAAHALLAGDDFARLLDAAQAEAAPAGAPLRAWARLESGRRRRVPAALVAELAAHRVRSLEAWIDARAKSDFALFRPFLERMLELKRRQAEALAPTGELYDAWLEEFEPGMTTERAAAVLGDIARGLVPLARRVLARGDEAPALQGVFPAEKQRPLCELAVREMGFDMARGRLDVSVHPFCCGVSKHDVRLTTRYHDDLPFSGLYSCLHEAGHGLYEQGLPDEWEGTPLGNAASMAVHESQSRLWENVVGRSRGFWRRWTPRFHEAFPSTRALGPEQFYRAANRVEASFIRVDADELTYSLHVILRFELEREMLAGRLKVAELPEAWNAKMKSSLGVAPPDDARGVLQDMHWSEGLFGYFPTYAIGNAISLQLWEAARRERPGLEGEIEEGGCPALLAWLRERVHRRGKTMHADELVKAATGRPIEAGPYLRYLEEKFGRMPS